MQEPEDDDRVEDVLDDRHGDPVMVGIPVAHGAHVPGGPIERPEQQRPVVVVDGDVADRVNERAGEDPEPKARVAAAAAASATTTPSRDAGAAPPVPKGVVPQKNDR